MISLIFGCAIIGFSLLYFLKFNKLSSYLVFSIPAGIAINSIIFWMFSIFNIIYTKDLFYLFVFIAFVFFLYNSISKKSKVNFDLNNFTLLYLLIIGYVLTKLIIMARTSCFDFYNTDEFTAYLKYSHLFYLTHNFSALKAYFLPVMHFISTVTFEINGSFDLSICRVISPIFFVLISFFIYYCLSEENVNKYLAFLISILFLFSSSENIVLAKTFYTNIIFSFYISAGSYLFFKNLGKKNNFMILSLVFLIAACFTRSEGVFLMLAIALYSTIVILLKNRKVTFSMIAILVLPFAIYFTNYGIINYISPTSSDLINSTKNFIVISKTSESSTMIDILGERLKSKNINSYLSNIYDQTFSNSFYFYNRCIFVVFILSIIIYVIYQLIFKNKKMLYINGILYTELIYILIVLFTQFFLFSVHEYLVAASFSRYLLAFMPLNYIILGICLFRNTKYEYVMSKGCCKMINKPKVLLVIPAYNEEKNILNTYNKILKYNKKNKVNYDIIVINDGSFDGTYDVCIKNKIPVISLPCNLGIGGAVQTGYKYAYNNNYDIAVQYDADGQHDISYIDRIIQPIVDGNANMVVGSRFIEKNKNNFNSTLLRRIGIKTISSTIRLCTKKKIYDTTSGFRAIDKSIIEKWSIEYPFEYPEPITNFELLKEGYKVMEVPVMMHERTQGKSSIHTWKSAYYMINVVLTILIKNIGRD